MLVLQVIFWASLVALVWTHVLYPLFVAALARLRPRAVRADESFRPRVALVIAAYNEDDVITAKLENALALDYPPELLRIVVASDASSDRHGRDRERASPTAASSSCALRAAARSTPRTTPCARSATWM